MPRLKPTTIEARKVKMAALIANGESVRSAAMQVGYSKSWAESDSYVLVRTPEFKDLIKIHQDKLKEEMSFITREWIGKEIKRLYGLILAAGVDKDGVNKDLKALASAVKALTDLAKIMGYDTATLQITPTGPLIMLAKDSKDSKEDSKEENGAEIVSQLVTKE